MPLAPEWQLPFVNIFKLCDVDTMKEVQTKGDVTEHMDKIIGKKVFKIRGAIPAVNYLRVPRTKLQSLGLTGRMLYIQIKATPVKVYAIHIEAATQDGNVHRVSLSNMYSPEYLKRKSNGVQLPCPAATHRWCVLAVDLRAALAGYTSSPFACVRAVTLCSWLTVRTMFTSDYKFDLNSLPSDMALSHALDSTTFEMYWMPKEPTDAPTMDFMPPPKRLPGRRRTTGEEEPARKPSTSGSRPSVGGSKPAAGGKGVAPSGRVRSTSAAGTDAGDQGAGKKAGGAAAAVAAAAAAKGAGGMREEGELENDLSSDDDKGTPPPCSPSKPPPLSPRTAAATTSKVSAANLGYVTAASGVLAAPQPGGGGASRPNPRTSTAQLPPGVSSNSAPVRPALSASTFGVDKTDLQGPPLEPDPALELVRMNAFSGEFVRCLLWIPGTDWVAFAAASVVVLMHMGSTPSPAAPGVAPGVQLQAAGRQRHLLGHSAFVCALAVSADGGLLASAQEGKQAVVRLWDVKSGACLAMLNALSSGLSCVDISPDVRALAAVGLDSHGRQTIALWNIAELRSEGKTELVTRQPTEYNIKVLRFSAYQEDHLLTAGRDSIRVYRLKNGQLRGTSVRLVPQDKRVTSHMGGVSAALGPNIFTDIAFEAGVGIYGVDAFKVYVSSASGAVFQVDYTTRQLDCIYQLHDAAINCLVIGDGLAITGGDDRLLRAWPLDFRDYLMEAEHEASVTSIALSPDALRLAIGIENGTLGCLHIPNHAYTTLLRSHCGAVNAVAVDPNRDQFCTVSSDGTLRIWDLVTHQQLFEFDAPGEAVTCIAYHPSPQHHELAAGFANGRIRVFDVPTTTLLQEQQQHRAAVAELLFSPSGDRLFSGGLDGALVVYDVMRVYTPVQFLSAGVRDIKVCVAFAPNGSFFATLSRDPYRAVTSLLVFHGRSLDPFMRIETEAPAYVKLAFSPDSSELWALTSSRVLERYELKEGQLVQQVHDVSPSDVTCLALDPVGRYALTAGLDGLLRLWGCVPPCMLRPRALPPNQAFLGHPAAVLGAAFHRGHLISVGDADCICVWRVAADAHAALHATALAAAHTRGLDPADAASARQRVAAAAAAAAHAATYGPDPRDPASRATPGTALGPVARPSDFSVTARAAALGTPLPGAGSTPRLMAPAVPRPPSASPSTVRDSASASAASAGQVHPQGASQLRAGAVPTPLGPPAPAGAAATVPSVGVSTPTRHAAAAPTAASTASALASTLASTHLGSSPRPQPAASSSHVTRAPPPPPQPPFPDPPLRPAPYPTAAPTSTSSPRLQLQQPSGPPVAPPPTPGCSWLLGYTPSSSTNVAWHASTGLFAYSVQDMVVLEQLASRQQRYLRGHTQPIACVAASSNGALVAAGPVAAEACPTGPPPGALSRQAARLGELAGVLDAAVGATFADVVVWDAATGDERWRFRYHPLGVQSLCFSPDGRWLLSLGRDPERSVVVWDVEQGLLVAAGRTEHTPAAAEWVRGGDNPVFATVGGDGLMLWTLDDSFLEQRSIPLSGREGQYDIPGEAAPPREPWEPPTVHCVALAVDPDGSLLVAEAPSAPAAAAAASSRVAVWHVEVEEGTAAMVQVAALPAGTRVTALAVSRDFALIATEAGQLLRFRRSTMSGTWWEESCVRLDGRVNCLAAEPGLGDVVAATSTATIWFVGMQDCTTVPIVCGQPAPVTGLLAAPYDARVVAATAQDGLLRMWRLGPEDAEPAVELQSTAPCTSAAFLHHPPPVPTEEEQQAALAAAVAAGGVPPPLELPLRGVAAVQAAQPDPVPQLLGGYADGSLRLFTVQPGVELVWAMARHASPVVGVAPHPRRRLVLSAASDGSLAVTDLLSTRLVSYITAYTAAGAVPASPAVSAKLTPRNGSQAAQQLAPRGGSGPLQALALSPGAGGSLCAAAWRDRLVVFHTPWDDPTCTPMAVYDCRPADGRPDSDDSHGLQSPDVPACVAFLPGATKHLVYSSPLLLGRVLVYDYRLAAVVRTVAVPQMVRCLAPHPGGTALLVGCMARSVFLLNLGSGKQVELGGHSGPVVAAAFTADGAHAVTAAGPVLMVWDAERELHAFDLPTMRQMMGEA